MKRLFMLLFCTALLLPQMGWALTSAEVEKAIQQTGARWNVRPGDVEPVRKGLGLIPTAAIDPAKVFSHKPAALLPSHFDWRNVGGKNYVTPVRDQAQCGSCWAFSSVAALESLTLIELNTPDTDLDLSEQAVVSCIGNGSCDGGEFNYTADLFKKAGVPFESCYPYRADDSPCGNVCSGGQSFEQAHTIRDWMYASDGKSVADLTILKSLLVTTGPMPVAFHLYNDFFYYESGVYTYATGEYEGDHAVLLVGYDDANQCFIVKNSWDTNWGEQGYFRIDYSMVTDSKVKFAYEAVAYLGPAAPQNRIVPRITVNGQGGFTYALEGKEITVSIGLDPVQQDLATPFEWWVWYEGEDGVKHSWVTPGQWVEGLHSIVNPLLPLTDYPVLTTALPHGTYTFHIAVDATQDGTYNDTWSSAVTLEVVKKAN